MAARHAATTADARHCWQLGRPWWGLTGSLTVLASLLLLTAWMLQKEAPWVLLLCLRLCGALLLGAVVSHVLVYECLQAARRFSNVTGAENLPNATGPVLVGLLEHALYVLALLAGRPEFIGVWLAVKVAGQWIRWRGPETSIRAEPLSGEISKHIRESQDRGRRTFNLFLFGSGLSVLLAFVTYCLILLLVFGIGNGALLNHLFPTLHEARAVVTQTALRQRSAPPDSATSIEAGQPTAPPRAAELQAVTERLEDHISGIRWGITLLVLIAVGAVGSGLYASLRIREPIWKTMRLPVLLPFGLYLLLGLGAGWVVLALLPASIISPILVGLAVAVGGPLITDRVRAWKEERHVRLGILNELRDLRVRLAWVVQNLSMKSGSLGEPMLPWVRDILEISGDSEETQPVREVIDKLLKSPDKTVAATLAVKSHDPREVATLVSRHALPFMELHLDYLPKLKPELQRQLLAVRAELSFLNEKSDDLKQWVMMTFSATDEVNRGRASGNVQRSEDGIRKRAKQLAERIGEVIDLW